MNALVPCQSLTPKSLSKSSVMLYHGIEIGQATGIYADRPAEDN
jgi:hypothetical protein